MKSEIFKKEVKIGMLHHDITTDLFNYIYFPQFIFWPHVKRIYLSEDPNSLLREQFLTIELKEEYYYT